jgi:hypothetical protein
MDEPEPRVESEYPYKYDIFLSYSREDNRGVKFDEKGWVSVFREYLMALVTNRLGLTHDGPTRVRIFFDIEEHPKHEPFPPVLKEAAQSSALLLCLCSRPYMQSDWCCQEVEHFVAAAGGLDKVAGRIFIARIDEVPPAEYRELFGSGIGAYDFFSRPPDSKVDYRLRFGGTQEEEMIQRLTSFSYDLGKKLQALGRQLSRKAVEEDGPAHELLAAALPPRPEQVVIYLAENSRSGGDARQTVRGELERLGALVLPQARRSTDPEL